MINLYTLEELLDDDFTEDIVDNWVVADVVSKVHKKQEKLLKKQFIEEKE